MKTGLDLTNINRHDKLGTKFNTFTCQDYDPNLEGL